MEHIQIVKIVVRANAGAEIGSCIREAAGIAVNRWEDVELIHNSKTYRILVKDIMSGVKIGE